MLGAGDVSIESGGETGKQTFSDIRKPSAVQNEIYKQMELNNTRMYGGMGGGAGAGAHVAAPAAARAPPSIRRRSRPRSPSSTSSASPARSPRPSTDAKKDELLKRM